MNRLRIALALFLALATPTLAHATNLVQNGSFSSGSADWTYNINADDNWLPGPSSYASAGCPSSACISSGPDQNYLYQDIATTVGNSYTLSFQASIRASPDGVELQALFGGATVEDLTSATSAYQTFTVSGLVATSASTELEFLGEDSHGLFLTSVDVENNGPAATPEPGTFTLAVTGLLTLAAALRRRSLLPS
jgi:hypothetical protein